MDLTQDQGELQLETRYLEKTIEFAHALWETALKQSKEHETAASDAYLEMQEYAENNPQDLYSGDDFEDLIELTQYAQPVMEQIDAKRSAEQSILNLQNTMDSPYFARIDFLFDGDKIAEKIYIGRSMLMDRDSLDVYVYDWRTPIASVFYRFGSGRASFEAPRGTIRGEVQLKRQYEIRRGKLLYYFDSDVQIIDQFLRNLLSKNTSARMKTIVETIQKDQDVVIRDVQSDVLMVQGAAGSGKTSIALHRVAYLMYQGLEGRLNANDILILSPNTVFEEYISHVLPDLGESSVKTVLLEDIFRDVLPEMKMQSRTECFEQLLTSKDATEAKIIKSSMAFKGSLAFARILERLVTDLPRNWIDFSDVQYDGQVIAHRSVMKASICNPKKIAPLCVRLKFLEHEILEKVHGLRKGRIKKLENFVLNYPAHATDIREFARLLSICEGTTLIRGIRAFTEIDSTAVYKRLFCDKDRFYRLAKGIELPEDIEQIRLFTCERLSCENLWYEDAAALTYLHAMIHGFEEHKHFRQVVLDEAQDEHPLHFLLLRELFGKARYTILGDVSQAIGNPADISLYETIGEILKRKNTTCVSLDKSFRCTMQIWQFSKNFLPPDAAGECFSRQGEEPIILAAPDVPAMDDRLVEEVTLCRQRGYSSVGLICKTRKDASALYERLKDRLDVRMIQNDSSANLRGVLIIPVYLAKGLEFDAVIVCDADEDHYRDEDDKRLLYVACTRALHRLVLVYAEHVSPLLEAVGKGGV